MSATIDAGMTVEELLALPENGMDRELICGPLRERPRSYRNRFHTRAVTRLAHGLERWLEHARNHVERSIRAKSAVSCGGIRIRPWASTWPFSPPT